MRECILLGGRSGSGKTTCALQIAEAYPDSRIYYIDTDGSARRIIELEFPHVKNLDYKFVLGWEKTDEAIKAAADKNLREQDWVILEMIDNVWVYDRRNFVKAVYGKGMAEYLMMRRLEMTDKGKKGIVLHTPQDWDIQSTAYMEALEVLWYQIPCHFLATTSVSEPPGGAYKEGKKSTEFYGSLEDDYGFRYDGHKENLYRFESHLVLAHTADDYLLTTVKERGSRVRRRLKRVKLHNFVMQYLCPVAGFPMPKEVSIPGSEK